ncbi:MAG TPA: hybrid sensor histidine kinase/response regulator [Myxococcota bacterium]|nr:hybrid sensor histidine kinase/response regulator [Myxococcota bacterium]
MIITETDMGHTPDFRSEVSRPEVNVNGRLERQQETVLIVDDNTANRGVAEGYLAAAGYGVVQARSGAEALVLFPRSTPDLILLDIFMPDMSGFEVAAQLRELPGGMQTPIVFVTASDDAGTHQAAMASAGDDFLTKPLDRVALLMRVRSLLRIKRISNLILESHQQLSRVEAQKEELISLVVHDLKSPLTAILSNTEFVLRAQMLEEESRAALHDVLGASRFMHRLVMNLLDISLADQASLALRPESIGLAAVLREIVGAVQHRASSRHQAFVLEAIPPEARLYVDPDVFRRLIENLLDNSCKYAPEASSVRLSARITEAQSIDVVVADEGPGLSPEQRERMFSHQLIGKGRGVLARDSRGLGLRFCRMAAEAHGGRIWVEANTPRGLRFCVRLPRAEMGEDAQGVPHGDL